MSICTWHTIATPSCHVPLCNAPKAHAERITGITPAGCFVQTAEDSLGKTGPDRLHMTRYCHTPTRIHRDIATQLQQIGIYASKDLTAHYPKYTVYSENAALY